MKYAAGFPTSELRSHYEALIGPSRGLSRASMLAKLKGTQFDEHANIYQKPKRSYRIKSKKSGSRQGVTIRELDSVGQQGWEIVLRRGGKPMMRIIARGVEQYRRALAGADLWARGASMDAVDKVVGKHVNA